MIYALSAEVLGTEVGLLMKNLYSMQICTVGLLKSDVLYDSSKATQLSLVVNENIFRFILFFFGLVKCFSFTMYLMQT